MDASEKSRETAAQLWCLPQHELKVMDCAFAESIALAIDNAIAAERAKVKELVEVLEQAIGWTGVATVTPEDGRAVDRIDRAAFLAIKDARAALAKAGV